MKSPFIDIHTHQLYPSNHEVQGVRSLRPRDAIGVVHPYTIGLHPWYEEDLTDTSLALLTKRAKQERIWGIGEAGLDRLSTIPLEVQLYYLEQQIQLSEALHLPLVVHCVKAWGELLGLLSRSKCHTPWIIHGFRGKPALAEQLLSHGCYLSLGQRYHPEVLPLAFKRGRLLLETDDKIIEISNLYDQIARQLGLPQEKLRAELYQQFLTLSPRYSHDLGETISTEKQHNERKHSKHGE